MADINENLYKYFRDTAENKIGYIAFNDENGDEVFRIPIGDARVTHLFSRDNQENTYVIPLTGSDAEFTSLPQTIASSTLYETVDSVEILSHDTMTPFQFYANGDNVVVTHKLQIPIVE